MTFNPGFLYKTKSGHQAKVLHSCTGCLPALIGFITLNDGDEVPATWNPQGESFRRDVGSRGSASEFDLLDPTQHFTKEP